MGLFHEEKTGVTSILNNNSPQLDPSRVKPLV